MNLTLGDYMADVTLTPYRMDCLKRVTRCLSELAALTAPRRADEEDLLTSQRMALSEAEAALVSFVWGVLDEADYDANCDPGPGPQAA